MSNIKQPMGKERADAEALRRRAEELLETGPDVLEDMDPGEVRQALEELQIHRIQLELQNEELRSAQQSLESARSRYNRLFNHAPTGYVVLDPVGMVKLANATFLDMIQSKGALVVGKPFADLLPEQDASVFRARLKAFFRNPQGKSLEVGIGREGTPALFVRLETVPGVEDPQSPDEGYDELLMTVSDITGQKRMEQEKAKLETRIRQGQKMEAIGNLAGGVAHDLNNLLSPIIGYAEMLFEDASLGNDQRESVGEIQVAGMRARDLVRQLLAFSRQQTLEFTSVDVNRVVARLEKLLRRTIQEDINIEIVPARWLPPIRADIGQLEQVVMNLAINARDAMPSGGTLRIETGETDLDEEGAERHHDVHPGRYVRLAVSDSGHGIDPETLERVFDPFFTTKEKGKGTGLGLSTVYGIVKQHGGYVGVRSDPGRGTMFEVCLPVDERVQPVASDESTPLDHRRGGETVLVVEDDQTVLKLAVMILERYGYKVLSASSGKACLRMLERHEGPIDLLLSDVVMPEINGKELYQRVATRIPGLKVLYMSGYTDNVIAEHGVLYEGVQFVQKPFSVQTLVDKVREVLDQRDP